jgi:flagella basal body P-ring formation protein FlgA
MTSFADVWQAAGLVPALLVAAPGLPSVPEEVATRVAAHIAQSWRVPAERLRLEWGRAGASMPGADAPFRVAGNGSDGRFLVVFDPAAEAMAIRVRAGLMESVVVAARPLSRGAQIAPGDLKAEERVRWGPPSSAVAAVPGPGWQVRRAIAAGEAVGWPAAVPPHLVVNGEPVRLLWTRGGVDVSVTGVALNSARCGERVRARVEGRSGAVTGIASARGVAVLTERGAR